MSAIDNGILVFALALAAIGWERGLVRSALPLVGFVGGVAIGARIGPALLEGGSESAYAPAVAAAGGILLGVFLAIALEGVGTGVRERLAASATSRRLDSLGGAALLAALGLAAAWVFGAVALNVPGKGTRDLREAVQRSSILVALNDAFPPSGPLLNTLRRIDPSPEVRGPEADVAAPPRGIVGDPDVKTAAASVLRVRGSACGLGVEGSGWIAAPEVVVTNAHVVAGQDDTTVTTPAGESLDVDVVHYEPRNDLAVLRVPGLTGAPLELVANPRRGTAAAAVGYPEGGPLTLTAARLGQTGSVISEDSYGNGPIHRSIAFLRGSVRSGNSGGPLVDGTGHVIGVNQQIKSRSGGGEGVGFAVPSDVVKRSLDKLRENGKVEYAYLGVQTVALYPQLSERFDLPVDKGAWVQATTANGPGDKAGLEGGSGEVRFQARSYRDGGDIITKVGKRPVRDADDLSAAVQLFNPGQKVEVEVWRDGKRREVEVELGTRPLSGATAGK